jgi:hypothetical protein
MLKERKITQYEKAQTTNLDDDWLEYRTNRNQYKAKLSRSKNEYINNKISESVDQKTMWKNIKKFVLKKDSYNINENLKMSELVIVQVLLIK